jgi:3'-5' exoribonuclease
MAKVYVRDVEPNSPIESPFLARTRSLLPFRNKPGQYLAVVLADKTGEIQARAWDNAERLAESFQPGDVILVRGRVEEYQGNPQIIIERLRKCNDDEIEPEDYIAASTRDPAELLGRIRETIRAIREPHLQRLLDSFFSDDQFVAMFTRAPAAKRLHHSYLGGLLEHVAEVVQVCATVCDVHPQLNRDLLLSAALLHDIGKLTELQYDTDIDFTDEGRLVGHVVIGDRMVQDAIDAVDGFPRHLAILLRHIILSHHGQREWGAPIVPMTPEAAALHYADIMDAKIRQFSDVAERTAAEGRSWSDWQPMLERYIYAGPPGQETAAED